MKTYPGVSLRTAPGVPVLLGILFFGAVALELSASALTRAGLPLKPATCVAALGVAIAPSFLRRRSTARTAAIGHSGHPRDARPHQEDPIEAAFRTIPAKSEILDASLVFPEFLFHATDARLAILPTGESLLTARFPDSKAAHAAAEGYRRFFGMSGPHGAPETGWRGARTLAHDVADLRCEQNTLVAWAARNHSLLDARLVATGGVPAFAA